MFNCSCILEEAIVDRLLGVIQSKFDLDSASKIEITSVGVDHAEQKIRIELLITTTEKPKRLAEGYFELTNKIREVLGSDWSGFFPVIAPRIKRLKL